MKKLILLFLALFLAIPASSSAIAILDQSSPVGGITFYKSDFANWEQGITAGMGGLLSQIDIWFLTSESVEVSIFAGAPWQDGVSVFDTTLNPTVDDWTSIDLSSANFFVDPGDEFSVMLHGSHPTTPFFKGNLNEYAGGEMWRNGSLHIGGEGEKYDMAFNTYVESAPVPEPTTMLLLSTGLIGLAGIGRKKFFKKE